MMHSQTFGEEEELQELTAFFHNAQQVLYPSQGSSGQPQPGQQAQLCAVARWNQPGVISLPFQSMH